MEQRPGEMTLAECMLGYEQDLDRRRVMGEKVSPVYISNAAKYRVLWVCADASTKEHHPTRHTDFAEGIGHIRIRDLTSEDVLTFRTALLHATAPIHTIRSVLGAIRTALNWASAKGFIKDSPARNEWGKGNRLVPARQSVPALAPSNFLNIYSTARERVRLPLLLIAVSGLAAEEVFTLRWKDLDLGLGWVKVSGRKNPVTIPLGRRIVAQLKAAREVSRYAAPYDYVFPRADGGLINARSWVQSQYSPLVRVLTVKAEGKASVHASASTPFGTSPSLAGCPWGRAPGSWRVWPIVPSARSRWRGRSTSPPSV